MRHGADDYLRKPFDGAGFQAALDRSLTRLTLARQNAALRRHLGIELARAGDAQAAGFFRYLTKPIKVNELMDTLRVALECAAHGARPGT